jgi:uncharacterized protein (TIGR02569 family)
MSAVPPPAAVLAAFGATGEPRPLPGGEGRTWVVGDVVLKPCGLTAEAAWIAEVLSTLPPSPLFRVARPVQAAEGRWVVSGWEAWRRLPGATDPSRWDEILEVGKAFHQALSGLPRPVFLDERDNPWTYGDRLAWDEIPLTGSEVMSELMVPLAKARRPLDLASQPVHADLLGNVMFADGLPPAVIDWPLYYRPPSWALAVVVVDALTWHDAPAELLDRCVDADEWDQLLIRALMFRIGTNDGFRRHGRTRYEPIKNYRSVVQLVLSRV